MSFWQKNVSPALGITSASSAIHAGIQKEMHRSGITTLIISNKEMNNIMEIIQALGDSYFLLKGITKKIKNEIKKPRRGILRNTSRYFRINLARKFIIRERNCKNWFWEQKRKGIVRAGMGIRNGIFYAASSFDKF